MAIAMCIAALVVGSAAMTEWSKIPNGYPYNYEQEHTNQKSPTSQVYINSTGQPVTQLVQFTNTLYDKVVQDPNTSGTPPWTTPYVSVYDNSQTFNWSYNKVLNAGYAGEGWDNLTISYGGEMWTNGWDIAARTRTKYVIVDPQDWKQWPSTE